MKNLIQLSIKATLLCFLISFYSCSKQDLEGKNDVSNHVDLQLPGLTSYTIPNQGCSSSTPSTISYTYSDYVSIGNGSQEKTLRSKVYNTDTKIFVEADYIATANNQDLPAKVTISIGDKDFSFNDVQPGETVKADMEISDSMFGTSIDINIVQVAFLEPAEVHVSLYVAQPCPLEVGAERYGGIVGYILQPGDAGYVEGETNGIVVSKEELDEDGFMTWENAMTAAANLEKNGYNDWMLPTGEESLSVLNSLDGFGYDPFYSYGYWTSVEIDETTALRATIAQSGLVSQPATIETSPFSKSSQLQVFVVRSFTE